MPGQQLSPAAFVEKWAHRFQDNSFEKITEATFREFTADIAATFDAAGGVGAGPSPGYTLAAATTTALGGLIVGQGLAVALEGTVSVKIDTATLGIDSSGHLYVLTTGGNISPAATPTNVTAMLTNGGYSAAVAWDAMPGATLYQVYRSVNGGPWTLIVGVPYTYYTDNSGVTQGGSAFVLYRVTAANSLGESTPSTAAQAV